MKCPPELACSLRVAALGQGHLTADAVERLRIEVQYFALCQVLLAPPRMKGGREPAVQLDVAQAMVAIAPLVQDPKGMLPLCIAYLNFVDRLKADDTSADLTNAANATLAAAFAAGFSPNRIAEFQRLRDVAVSRCKQGAEQAVLDGLAAKVEAGMARLDGMSADQQRRFSDEVATLARRSRRFAHPLKLSFVNLPRRHGRARRPARRAAHRPSSRRAQSDSGGDGDGPGDGDPPQLAWCSQPAIGAALLARGAING